MALVRKRRKLGGPPKREPKEGERVALSLRMTPDLKRRLDAAAEQAGRSQSQEAEFRLEHSFDRTALLGEVLTLTFGKPLAGLLLAIGVAMRGAGETTLVIKGRHHVYEDWTADPDAYHETLGAFLTLWRLGAPPVGETSSSNHAVGNGSRVAREIVRDLRGDQRPFDHRLPHTDTMRQLLGPISTRMIEALPSWEAGKERERKYAAKIAAQRERAAARRATSHPEELNAIDRSLGSLADDVVQIVEDTYKPSSTEVLAELVRELVSKLHHHEKLIPEEGFVESPVKEKGFAEKKAS